MFILSVITSVFSHSNLVPIWYRLGGYSNEHVRAFRPSTVTEVGIRIAPLLYKGGADTLVAWHCMALRKVLLGIPGGEKPSSRMRIEVVHWQLLKNGIPFFYKSKVIIANQVRAYASSLAFGL